MDVLDIDISDIPEATIGDEVLFLGEEIPLQDCLDSVGMDYSNCEKLMFFGSRVKRVVSIVE